jgi:hypothetical protein
MIRWTLHERSATLETDREDVVQEMISLVAEGGITVPTVSKKDGVFNLEVYVTPPNPFRTTLRCIFLRLRDLG